MSKIYIKTVIFITILAISVAAGLVTRAFQSKTVQASADQDDTLVNIPTISPDNNQGDEEETSSSQSENFTATKPSDTATPAIPITHHVSVQGDDEDDSVTESEIEN